MELMAAAVVAFACVVFATTSRHSANVLPFVVGVTAGLIDARLGRLHIFSALVALWVVVQLGSRRRHSLTPFLVIVGITAIAASSVLFGDLVNSNTLAIQLLILSASSAAIVGFAARDDIRTMLLGLLATCSAGSFVGALQIAGVIQSTLFHTDVSGLGRPMSFYPEPDWLGLFSAIGVVLAWRSVGAGNLRNMLVLLNGAVFVFAFARAAWVAVGLSVLLLVIANRLRKSRAETGAKRPVAGILVLVLLTGFIGLAASPQLRSDLDRRIGQTFEAQDTDISGQARIAQTQGLVYLGKTAPWYGHGVSASGRVGVSGRLVLGGQSDNNVGSNWVLSMWVDSKYLAVPLILMLGLTALAGVSTIPGQLLIVALTNSFFSNATYTPIVWFLLGLTLVQMLLPTEGRSRPQLGVNKPRRLSRVFEQPSSHVHVQL
jgi:hypothetical protein